MTRILGIDPGSRVTGWGVIESDGRHNRHIAHGHIRVEGECLADKLACIFSRLNEVVREHQPAEAAVEEVFMSKNASSALKLGQARGAAVCAVSLAGLTVAEYAARLVKQSVVGKGSADKVQVQHMVGVLLSLQGQKLQADAADALGVALCHGHLRMHRALSAELRAEVRS